MTQLPPDPPEINVANAARGLPLTWMGVFYLARAALRARRAPTLKGGGSGGNGDQDSPRAYIYLTPVSKSGWSGGQRGSGQPVGVYLSHTGIAEAPLRRQRRAPHTMSPRQLRRGALCGFAQNGGRGSQIPRCLENSGPSRFATPPVFETVPRLQAILDHN